MIRNGTALARSEWCDSVVGFGGGAVIDAAKAIAVLITNEGDVLDYLEIIGGGKTLTEPPVPLVAIPTTAGTGSEVTCNSVIRAPEHRIKVSLRSRSMLPKVALVDPEATHTLSPDVTATTGIDALTQLIEAYVCTHANPVTDGLCQEGISRVARSLRRAVEEGRNAAAREDMAVASLFGGLALANAGLGAVHGIAGPLGGMVSAPHGAVCAALLPEVVATNLEALREREPKSDAIPRYAKVAKLLSRNSGASAGDAVTWLRRLVVDLAVPRLGTYGFAAEQMDELVEKAAAANSMKGNPVELTPEELESIVRAAL
jgi:alcohol dehydrogenase class IV